MRPYLAQTRKHVILFVHVLTVGGATRRGVNWRVFHTRALGNQPWSNAELS
jgi:hypothetical protein